MNRAACIPVAAALAMCADPSLARDLDALPPLPAGHGRKAERDWLIDGSGYEAGVYRGNGGREVVLTNGLVSRTFRVAPNAATVGLRNHVTDQEMLRGVKPEAVVTIDGTRRAVGGLVGQPNHAFLLPKWLDRLEADPEAFALVGLETGTPAERLAWKRARHCAPDAKWPPAGVSLRLDFRLSAEAVARKALDGMPASAGRKRLAVDEFSKPDRAWRVRASGAHARSSFENEGKWGEVYTPSNTAVFAERAWPEVAEVAEVSFNVGTDRSASWGPGIALVWPDLTVKLNLRPGDDAHPVGVWDGRRERLPSVPGAQAPGAPWVLRVRVDGASLRCEAGPEGGAAVVRETVDLGKERGAPTSVRVGKIGREGDAVDFAGEKGELVRLRVRRFALWGALAADAASEVARGAAARGVIVSVHYELYDGIPAMCKWLTVRNDGDRDVTIDGFTSELLAAVEHSALVEARGVAQRRPNLHVETDYAFLGMGVPDSSRLSVHWVPDPDYATQVNYRRQTPCLLEARPEMGPAARVAPGGTFESFRTFVLPLDGHDRERSGLAQRRMYRIVAPWVTENPLMMHVRRSDSATVRNAVDQCAEVGFEMVILSFGSGFNIENDSGAYVAEMARHADYARGRGVEIGGYSLLASRRVGGGHDVVMPPGRRPAFGNSPCLGSAWGREYFRKLHAFFERSGFTLLEHDGSYPGDECASGDHPGHGGLADSRWTQWRTITDFYKWCRARGVFLNVPDYYFLSGSNKTGMGYRETNWSLPREQQVIHTRQNIHDGTWEKTPSMGWMFVPLTQYHGGGAAATIEPLDRHREHYERMLCSNLALGVQACYRGPRLYDTDRTKALVKRWVDWFKEYRDILESDLVHGRRADGRDVDWMLHVNPRLRRKGMLVAFNPLPGPVDRTLAVDLYYTGLTDVARVRERGGRAVERRLDRRFRVDIPVRIEAGGMTWFVIE